MADAYIVDINLKALRDHRSQLERRDLSEDDVRMWLVNFGFYPRVDGLYVAESDILRHLDPTEINAARPVGVLNY